MRDGINSVHPVVAIAPQVAANDAAIVSAVINIADYNTLSFFILLGVLADAAFTTTVLVEHGDTANLADAAAVPDDMLVGTEALASFTEADDGECRKIGYLGGKQYVRLTITPNGNAGNLPVSALALLGHPRHGPTPNPPQ